MPRGKKHGPEEVIPKLREAEVLISQGSTQELAAKQIGVTKQTLDLPPVTVPVVKFLFAAPLGQPLHFVEA